MQVYSINRASAANIARIVTVASALKSDRNFKLVIVAAAKSPMPAAIVGKCCVLQQGSANDNKCAGSSSKRDDELLHCLRDAIEIIT